MSALVASARVFGLAEDARMLVAGPMKLADVEDIERLGWISPVVKDGSGCRRGHEEGKNRKRIRLRLEVPGDSIGDTSRLAADLAGTTVVSVGQLAASRVLARAEELLRDLIGDEI